MSTERIRDACTRSCLPRKVQVVPFGIDVARLNVRLIANVDEMLRSQRDPMALFRGKRVEQRCKKT